MAARAGVPIVAFLAVGLCAADAAGGVVAGKLERPPGGAADAPVRSRAFLPRLENPHAPVEAIDPVPAMVVVLEPAAGTELPPPKATVTYDLLGDSFARPLFAARVGQQIELRNLGRAAPIFVARGQPKLFDRKPLNPTDRQAFTPTAAGLIDLVDETTPHLRGRVLVTAGLVAFPDAAGRFDFGEVPAGEYALRVYYAPREHATPSGTPAAPVVTGWIDRPDDKLTVGGKRVDVTVKLPPALPVKP